jgi:hypothetical protein
MTTSGKPPITWATVDLAKSTAEAFSKECRDAPRFRCSGIAEIAVPGAPMLQSGQLRDLSLTGCRILTASTTGLAKSTAVEVLLDIDGLKVRLPARVVRNSKQEGTALRFGMLSPRNADLIYQVSNEVAAKADEAAKKDAKASKANGASVAKAK